MKTRKRFSSFRIDRGKDFILLRLAAQLRALYVSPGKERGGMKDEEAVAS